MFVKRIYDIVFSTIGLFISSPIILIAVIMVRLSSKGRGILIQKRVGIEERLFDCYKIRTMYYDTPLLPTHMMPSSQITPLGKLLRKTRIDELPQFLNVLKGEMSLVGPRPCLPTQLSLINARKRVGVLKVRPGITGLAQVLGVDMSDARKLSRIDSLYVRKRTLLLDAKILVVTILGTIMFRRGQIIRNSNKCLNLRVKGNHSKEN